MSFLLQSWNSIVKQRGDAIAVTAFPGPKSLTFREVDDLANQWVFQNFRQLKNSRSRIVGIKIESRPDWLIAFLSILKVGAIILPVDNTSTVEETRRLIEAVDCNAWFHGDQFNLLHHRSHYHLQKTRIQIFKVTSGSTSQPKIIPFTESQMVADARNILDTMRIELSDVQFATIPLGHSYGLGSLVYPFFLRGIPLVFNSIPLPSIIEKELKTYPATVMPTIPGILNALAQSDSVKLPPALRLVISAASPLTPDLIDLFEERHGLKIHNFYGSTETGGIAYDDTGNLLTLRGAVGAPMQNVRVEISRSGRVRVESEAVYTYRNRNRSGKMGTFLLPDFGVLKDGALVLKGRSNRIIKHNGKRVDLSQVEHTLFEHPMIREVYVVYDERRRRIIAAVAGSLDESEFRQFALERLTVWKRPKVVWITSRIPTNARGKPDRQAILKGIAQFGTPLRYEA